LKLLRWAAALALAIALAPGAAFAQEDGTITISSTFNMVWSYGPVGPDLDKVYANGHEHTWALTLHGTTHSHSTSYYLGVSRRNTQIHATVVRLRVLRTGRGHAQRIVSEYIAEREVMIELSNYYSSGGNAAFMCVQLKNDNWDLVFYVGHDFLYGSDGSDTLFPSDAYGYPVVGPDPFSIWSDFSYIQDWRPWNEGWIYSWENLVTFAVIPISSPLPGDINGDNVVDAADYVLWRKNGGSQASYNDWRANFGALSPGAAAVARSDSHPAVPEPVTTAYLLFGIAGLGMAGPTTIIRRRPAAIAFSFIAHPVSLFSVAQFITSGPCGGVPGRWEC